MANKLRAEFTGTPIAGFLDKMQAGDVGALLALRDYLLEAGHKLAAGLDSICACWQDRVGYSWHRDRTRCRKLRWNAVAYQHREALKRALARFGRGPFKKARDLRTLSRLNESLMHTLFGEPGPVKEG